MRACATATCSWSAPSAGRWTAARVHRHHVEALVAGEAAALQAAVVAGEILRLERRGTVLVAELTRAVYMPGRLGHTGPVVPILGQRREAAIVVALRCDNYDTDPPSV